MTSETAFGPQERTLLDDSMREYFKDDYRFEHFQSITTQPDGEGLSRSQWQTYADMGWLGIALPESAGGTGGGMTELGILLANVGRHLVLEPFIAHSVIAMEAIVQVGTPAQRESLLPDAAYGQRMLGFAHYEHDSGYARDHVTTRAQRTSDGYELTGQKAFALHNHAADILLISARVGSADDAPVCLFLLDRNADGVELAVAPALDMRKGAAVSLQAACVPASALLGEVEQDGSAQIDALLDRGAIAVCAEAIGAMSQVTELTVDYLKSRKQFGRPLSEFQVLQHRLVDMSIHNEESRAAIGAALQAIDEDPTSARKLVWRAKVQTARSAHFVGGQGVQLHGGMGMTNELAIGHFYKRLNVCETQFGDARWYLSQLSALES